MREDAMTAIEPAIGPPRKSVQRLMRVLVAPAIQEDLRRTSGFVFAGLDRHKHEIGSRPDPDAAETNFETADQVQVVHEDGFLVEFAVSIGVFENQDAIVAIL